MKMRCRKRRTEFENDSLLHSDVVRDWIRRIRTDTQNISTVGWYRAPDIQRARLERRRRLVGGGSGRLGQRLKRSSPGGLGAVLVNASA
jgi:hypothetical protein